MVNLGSPDSTSESDVREYLSEFLDDPKVVDFPWPVRKAVLNLFILPFRPAESAESYEKIWGPEGSPLIVTTENVADKLRDRIDTPVEIGMRYRRPSIKKGVERLRAKGVDHIFLIPLYPHFAMSSYETVVAKTQEVLEERDDDIDLTVQPPFYDDPDYIDALIDSADDHLDSDFDKLLMSYHGVPVRQIEKRDPTGCYCLQNEDCCKKSHPAHDLCYRHQVYKTSWMFADRAGIDRDKLQVSFQSRLGPIPWLKPATADLIEEFPSQGVKDIVVMCPAFVSDCLETIEEIGMEGREDFMEAGGKNFELVPCLNENEAWIDLLERFVDDFHDGDLREDGAPIAAEPAAE
jgi:ferrochelatase